MPDNTTPLPPNLVPLLESDQDPKVIANSLVWNMLPALTLRLISVALQGDRMALIYLLNRALGTPTPTEDDPGDMVAQIERLVMQRTAAAARDHRPPTTDDEE